ncbi:MAG: hypothetical protein P9F75_06675 [Candidatus Contendobacter sp.]|nr:hypothetical protein [Candidatus Contendobacter sp.]
MASPSAPDSGSSSLLAFAVNAFVVLLAIAVLAALFMAPRSDPDIARENGPGDDRKGTARYYSVRLLAALQTFESGILPTAPAAPAAPWTDRALLAGVPACEKAWNDPPGRFAIWRNEVRNLIRFWARPQALPTETTAQRMAAQLDALDAYLAQVGKANDGRAAGPVALDRERWFEAVKIALAKPLSPEGQRGNVRLQVQCADLRDALRTLIPKSCRQDLDAVRQNGVTDPRLAQARQSCGALESLSWRGTTPKQQIKTWSPEQIVRVPSSLVAERDPWQGVPGCIYWSDGRNGRHYLADAKGNRNAVCENADVAGWPARTASGTQRPTASPVASRLDFELPADDPRWSAPPSLGMILRPLDTLRQPGGTLYQELTERKSDPADPPDQYGSGPNRMTDNGEKQDVGFSVDLTIDARAQTLAQQVAACYTGAQALCQALRIDRDEDSKGKGKDGQPQPIGHQLLENAMVRMAGIAIIDIDSGRIEALAGALSPCARQDYDGPGRDPKRCDDRLPWKPAFRPDALENQALFFDAMPASTVKPIMAAAFLSDGDYGQHLLAAELASLQSQKVAARQRVETAEREKAEAEREKAAAEREHEAARQEKPTTRNAAAQQQKRLADAQRKIQSAQNKWAAAQKKIDGAATQTVKAPPPAAGLRRELMTSNSAAFLNRMFCAERGFADCQRPWAVQAAASGFGWNAACDPPTGACGKRGVLFGRAPDQVAEDGLVTPLDHPILFGRWLARPDSRLGHARFGLAPQPKIPLDPADIKDCAWGEDEQPSKDDWRKCPLEIVAEGWGQGNARVTAVGAAGMMAALGAAANGAKEFFPPFLVAGVRGAGDPSQATPRLALQRYAFRRSWPIAFAPEVAQVILGGLNYSHRKDGTASAACNQIFGAKGCADIDWIAGKTGTPTFSNDERTLNDIAKRCKTGTAQARSSPGCGELRPYKWYVAVFRGSAKQTRWDKAIAVLTERNWVRETGKVYGAGDHGPNPAAEIALQIAGRLRGDLDQ